MNCYMRYLCEIMFAIRVCKHNREQLECRPIMLSYHSQESPILSLSGESKCINLPLSHQYIVEEYDVQMLFNILLPGCWMEQHDVRDKSFHFSHEIHSWKKIQRCWMYHVCLPCHCQKNSNIFTIGSKNKFLFHSKKT